MTFLLKLTMALASGGDGDLAAHVKVESFAGASAAAIARVESETERGAAAAAAWLGVTLDDSVHVAVRWFESHASMGRELGAAALVLDDPRCEAVALTFGSGEASEGSGLAARAGACATLRALVPRSSARLRLALAELAVDPACAPDCASVAAALRSLGELPEWSALVDPAQHVSPELARVALISYLAALPASARAQSWLEPDGAALAAWSESAKRAATSSSAAPPAIPSEPRGFCFAHEGYRWDDGYGSAAARQSLARVKELGANAVSLTPFAFQRDVARPAIGTLFERSGGGFAPETDASLEVTANDARALGLAVVLKPHLWCGHDRWCGEIAMTCEEDWSAWFAEYGRVALHYGLLARRLRLPVFCLGTELQGTTRREAQWRALVAKVRAVYPGALTYCSNWGEEVEHLPFWDALDVAGVSAYWPLADASGATSEQLAKQFGGVLARMQALRQKVRRPLWFLEIGFAGVKEPWLHPNSAAGTLDGGEDQAIAYRVVLEATRDARFPDGLFWWKWSTVPERAATSNRRDFWPCGGPAEGEVERAWAGDPARKRGER